MLDLAKSRVGVVALIATTVGLLALGLTSPGSAGAQAAGPTYLGPLKSSAENSTTDWGRDAGFSVALPNGRDFWIFGDTPLYQLLNGAWYLTNFVDGSTAGVVKYTLGQPPPGPFNEFALGKGATATTPPQHFLPNPKLHLPDGSWRPCTKAVAGSSTESVRWPQGAVLMPDKVNILVSYLGVCTFHQAISVQSFGFALYNWKTRKFSLPPFDVFPPSITGAEIPEGWNFVSPVIVNNQVTFYSFGNSIYSTTVAANLKALKDRTSYHPTPIPGLPQGYPIYVRAIVHDSTPSDDVSVDRQRGSVPHPHGNRRRRAHGR